MTAIGFWRLVFTNWDNATCLDLHEIYGIDNLDPTIQDRPWWWLRVRILGLLDRYDSRVSGLVRKASK